MREDEKELVRAYSIPIPPEHREQVRELVRWYTSLLQRAIDRIWENISWEFRAPRLVREKGELRARIGKMHVPKLPLDREFQRELRRELVALNDGYSTRWIDSAIRVAFSIMKSWRKRYLRGRARRAKPRLTERFARARWDRTVVDYERREVRITLRPREYLKVSWKGSWFEKRVEGWELGEPILKENKVILPFKRELKVRANRVVGWDSNELSLDGYDGRRHLKVDLREIQALKIVYERKKARAQQLRSRELYEKYERRERNRERDLVNKIVAEIVRKHPNAVHVFEKLDKEGLVRKGRNKKERRKRNSRTPWRTILRKLGERSVVAEVNPRNTSRTCPRCGFKAERQKNAAMNILLKFRSEKGERGKAS